MAILSKSRFKAVLLVMLLLFVGMVTGFFLGAIVAGAVAKRRENPTFWKETVHKQIAKLKPTPEQRKKLEERADAAVQKLAGIKKDTIRKVWDVVSHESDAIEKDLTAEQRKTFETIKPKKPAELKDDP